MALTIADLPNEIVLHILIYISPEDLNNVFSISQFRQRLENVVKLIKDQPKTQYFTNIPSKSEIILRPNSEIPSAGLLEVFEIANFEEYADKLLHVKDQIPKIITILDEFEHMKYEVIGLLPTEDWGSAMVTRYVEEQGLKNSGFSFLTFKNLTNLALEEVKVDPLSISLPSLRAIHFVRCTSSNETAFFDFPKLEYLQITGMIKSLDRSFDYSQYPTNLELYQAKGWYRTNTVFTKLKKLTIRSFQHDTLCTIEDCFFPELRDASLNQTKFLLLQELDAPKLIRLSISSSSDPVTLDNINTPSLIHMDITTTVLPVVRNFYAPKLEYIFAEIQHVASEDPKSFELFEKVPGLIIRERPLALLERIDTRNLKYLCVDIEDDDTEIFDFGFPNLQGIEISLSDSFTQLPHIHAPNVKQLAIVDCPGLETLSNIPSDFSSIEELRLDLYESDLVLNGLTFPNLKALEIITEGEMMQIEGCKFPKLERLSITGTMFATPTTVDFEAPELLDYKIINVDIKELYICTFPKLQRLSIHRVQELHLGNLDSLVYLNLSYNIFKSLKVFHALPNLRYLETVQSNAEEFDIPSGLHMTATELALMFGDRYDTKLDSIPLQEFEGLSSCLDTFYQKLSDELLSAI
ncbi:unnamed protein product [Wickerhamomyces anomalus]